MTTTETRTHDDTDRTDTASSDAPSDQHPTHGYNESVDAETRQRVLDKYDHRCQACGRRGPEQGGLATMQVHHIDRDPAEMDEHDIQNLTLLCRSCHNWLHQQSTPEDSPVEITEADQSVLLPQDIEILRYLERQGPTRTGDIASNLSADLTVSSVRQRLWALMGLDNLVESRDRQIVDKDIDTGEWGLAEQIENSARGHIPDDPQLLVQRVEDEQVRQALDRGVDRQNVTEVLGIARRTSFNKQKRAAAYGFPLAAFNRGGRPKRGTRPVDNASGEAKTEESDAQRRLDDVDDQASRDGESVTWTRSQDAVDLQSLIAARDGSESVDDTGTELRTHLREAITALEEVEREL
ncbi:Restriction endonuclease, HNH family [Halanaeroarchaeum sp. HSR-CO]|uniref:HNH endonuclease n=1 Tax=Halanaeroarchaeum sp. HSR-CO TaxID=2866382 RepID=UPI00217F037F|nr:HNH endonuclease signature motif containing protein [Halanaeroarchaeum sp. HSR-CO]UWG47811.1 Restriction endonuclease, HNH family [Halanaeroarchaeum sp. HSR-CO]